MEEKRRSLGVSSLSNTFQNFLPWPGTEEALAAFKALASGETKWQMLLCYGGVGNGKTYLCEATTIALADRGLFARVNTMAGVMRSLRGGLDKDAIFGYNEMFPRLCKLKRLIIDDVGMGSSGSDWEYGQLEELIAERYRENLFTILTTNRDIKPDTKHPNTPVIPERIVSRFRDREKARLVLNQGEDYRPEKEKAR